MNIEDMNQINDMSCEGRQTMKRSLLAITFGNSVPVLLINLCRKSGGSLLGIIGRGISAVGCMQCPMPSTTGSE